MYHTASSSPLVAAILDKQYTQVREIDFTAGGRAKKETPRPKTVQKG